MRKIITPEEKEKSRKRNSSIIGVFLLFLLIASTAGYALLYNGDSSNDVQQDQQQTGQGLNFNGQTFYLTSSENSVKNINVNITKNFQDYAGRPLYIASDNNAVLAEFALTLGKFTSNFQRACYGKCEENLPEKDCSTNLIVWKDSLENKVYQEDNCVFIEGDIDSADAFLYKILK